MLELFSPISPKGWTRGDPRCWLTFAGRRGTHLHGRNSSFGRPTAKTAALRYRTDESCIPQFLDVAVLNAEEGSPARVADPPAVDILRQVILCVSLRLMVRHQKAKEILLFVGEIHTAPLIWPSAQPASFVASALTICWYAHGTSSELIGAVTTEFTPPTCSRRLQRRSWSMRNA